MVGHDGLWPGVVAMVGDAARYGVLCAKRRSGAAAVQAVIDSSPGYACLADHEGNPLTAVLSGSGDLLNRCCGDWFTRLDDEDGSPWQAMSVAACLHRHRGIPWGRGSGGAALSLA
jgi:hypothetical protein